MQHHSASYPFTFCLFSNCSFCYSLPEYYWDPRAEGEARDLVDELSDADKNNYKKVIEVLQAHYESPHLRSLARQKLSDCKQNPNESVHDFAKRIKKLARRVTLGQSKSVQNERLLDEFLNRLKHALKFYVKASNPPTYDEAVVKDLTYEFLLTEAVNNLTIFPAANPATAQVNVATTPAANQGYDRRNQPQGLRSRSQATVRDKLHIVTMVFEN
ncbi:retrotransposon gag protein [Ancylostoma caninum]|uniref:Retrotransposon gag protein n=1 Tax=Ancylostoma caninum TaxID=29170 RepID=A0A368GQ74_ANCCA|nr:retrotransposon gag protein [Ancylostoma caninum]